MDKRKDEKIKDMIKKLFYSFISPPYERWLIIKTLLLLHSIIVIDSWTWTFLSLQSNTYKRNEKVYPSTMTYLYIG
jgi:hypothetical protein